MTVLFSIWSRVENGLYRLSNAIVYPPFRKSLSVFSMLHDSIERRSVSLHRLTIQSFSSSIRAVWLRWGLDVLSNKKEEEEEEER